MAAAKSAPDPNSVFGGMTEFGASGLRQFSGYVREEWLRDLQGWRGIRMIREMRDNDPIIGAVFFAIEMLLRGVPFRIEPADKTNADDVEAAAFVNSCMSDMEQSWPEFMAQALTFLQYGFSVHEIVYKFRKGKSKDPKKNSQYDDGMIGWRKFAGRAQETLLHWEFDESGDATAMVQLLPTGGSLLKVPLSKCLHFVTVPLKNSPEGRSILRNAYVSYYRKKRIEEIEAIGIERDLAGLPIAWVPPEIMKSTASAENKATYEAIKRFVRDTVRNEQEGGVFPLSYSKDGHKLFDFTLMSTGGRRQFDTVAIIDRYDHRIAASMLADFIVLGAGSQQGRGSFAQAQSKTGMFGDAVTSFLDLICAVFNMKGIPDLLELNSLPGKVRMAHGDVTPSDITALGDYVSKLVGAAVLTADDGLEAHMREEAGLPDAENIGSRSLNEGGEASEGGDRDPAETASDNPADAQGRGDDGDAG